MFAAVPRKKALLTRKARGALVNAIAVLVKASRITKGHINGIARKKYASGDPRGFAITSAAEFGQ
jgi:hypothetical protein